MNALSNLFMITDRNVSLSLDDAIRVSDLSLGYGGPAVISGVSFSVHRGERLAIIGANGAGKSTLLKGMLGLLRPDAGQASFLGRPFWAVRPHVAFVAQADETDWDFPSRVRDLVAMGRGVHLGLTGRLGVTDWLAVDAAMERLNITELATRPLAELSGGQRRRVLLARALAQDPQIMLLDEPFQAIDASTREALIAALDDFREEGKTALVVHHNLGEMRSLFDRVALLDHSITAIDRPEAVLASAAFERAFGISAR